MSQTSRLSIPDALAEQVRAAAERQHMSAAEWLQHAVERALAASPPPGDALARLASLGAPTADIDVMLSQIEAGRS